MIINEVRIYSEVYEQGIDIRDYILSINKNLIIKNVYSKKSRGKTTNNSVIEKIRNSKDIDILVTFIDGDKEYPILIIEYSTAVPTDDHKMQRSDVYFWSSIYQTPNIKIYPKNKGMSKKFGGGDKLSDEFEKLIAFKNKSIFIPIKWNSNENNVLEVSDEFPSCIKRNLEIIDFFETSILHFQNSNDFENYYNEIYKLFENKYKDSIKKYDIITYSFIKNSNRFKIEGEKVIVKINRFGHAMDPDRGILYFVNMLIGSEKTVTEIQINRNNQYDSKTNSYKSLFDGVSQEKEIKSLIKKIILNKNNSFNEKDAIDIFLKALNLENKLIIEKNNDCYYVNDENLIAFLKSNAGMSAKSIFYLSQELRLTDLNRKLILKVKWNYSPIQKFFLDLKTYNFEKTKISRIESEDLNEDLITFSSSRLLKNFNFDLHAISYPGAQGDKAILIGEGRKIRRTYIDIISSKVKDKKISLHLLENKDIYTKTSKDIEKLSKISESKEFKVGLEDLLNKQIKDFKIEKIYTAVGTKKTSSKPKGVDYFFLFNISNRSNKTLINYEIHLLNHLCNNFFDDNLLKGSLILEEIYKIVSY
jgi:hypothetical protein